MIRFPTIYSFGMYSDNNNFDLTAPSYCRNAPTKPFHRRSAWIVLKKLKERDTRLLLEIKAQDIERNLMTMKLFPLNGLLTKDQHEVFYMKPSRHIPRKTPTKTVIKELAYVMNTMLEKESNNTNGIAFLANMDDWEFGKHFETQYCYDFMKMLQGGRIPVRVQLFLIVNPKPWFKYVWSIMSPMLSEEFRAKVQMIPESLLVEYLADGYDQYLPDEMESGKAPTSTIVQNFVRHRLRVEHSMHVRVKPSMSSSFRRPKRKKILSSLFAAKGA